MTSSALLQLGMLAGTALHNSESIIYPIVLLVLHSFNNLHSFIYHSFHLTFYMPPERTASYNGLTTAEKKARTKAENKALELARNQKLIEETAGAYSCLW